MRKKTILECVSDLESEIGKLATLAACAVKRQQLDFAYAEGLISLAEYTNGLTAIGQSIFSDEQAV